MKRIMMCVAISAAAAFGLGVGTSSVHADHIPGDPDEHGPYVTEAEVGAPVPTPTTAPPILTVPPVVDNPLPSTGTDSMSTITIASVAGATGLGLVIVARSRRRKPATQS